MAECKQCGKEYQAKRSTSVYCGPKCKQEFYRNRMKPVVTVSNAKPVTVTEPKCITIGDQARSMKMMAMMHSDACKRGKDIKTFADLSPDVQQTIDMMSTTDGKIDKTIKLNRTAIAINYQHLFPGRYHSTSAVSTGTVIGKPGDADYDGICTPEWRAERGR